MFELFKSAKYSQAIDTTFLTQHTLTWSMLTIFLAVVIVIAISIWLMCGDSKEEMEKKRKRREKRKKRGKVGSDSSESSKRFRTKHNNLRSSLKQSSGVKDPDCFGEVDKHSDLKVPLLA